MSLSLIRVSSWVCHLGGPWPVSQLTKPAWRILAGQGVRGSRAHLTSVAYRMLGSGSTAAGGAPHPTCEALHFLRHGMELRGTRPRPFVGVPTPGVSVHDRQTGQRPPQVLAPGRPGPRAAGSGMPRRRAATPARAGTVDCAGELPAGAGGSPVRVGTPLQPTGGPPGGSLSGVPGRPARR